MIHLPVALPIEPAPSEYRLSPRRLLRNCEALRQILGHASSNVALDHVPCLSHVIRQGQLAGAATVDGAWWGYGE